MRRVLVLATLLLLVLGCKDSEVSNAVPTVEEATAAQVQEQPVEPEDGNDFDVDDEAEAKQDGEHADETSAEPASNAAPPVRDLGAELRAAVGTPVDCLNDYRPSPGTTVRISISAIVRQSGLLIEPSASGAGLSANDRRCIEQRVGDVVLAPFEAETSQPVSTYIDLVVGSGPAKEDDVGGPAPVLKDVMEIKPEGFETIRPSGVPIEELPSDPPVGPRGDSIEGPSGVPIEGPKPEEIEGYQLEEKEGAERWTE
jgi:hypothetical protein